MIRLKYYDAFGSGTVSMVIEAQEDGGFLISRKGAVVTQNYEAKGCDAARITQLLDQIPGPSGANDLEKMIYDGETLEIEDGDAGTKTIVGLSLAHRSADSVWFEEFDKALREIK